ncbi:MAG: anion permease [Clostridia bacterium]|nr:anion permease [Clostridia bacterium]
MAIYLLLFAGIFMGWSLGTNDGANAFGTAVATGVVKYRTAITIIAIFVVIGAFLQGEGNLMKVAELATGNEVMASEAAVQKAVAEGTADKLVLKSAIKAAIVFTCAAVTVFIMSYLKFPVSANQSITGAIVGWGLLHADYSDPALRASLLGQLGKFASTWLLNPLGAAIISFAVIKLANKFLIPRLTRLSNYDKLVKVGYLIAGGFASYSIGMNSSANVTALYYGEVIDGVQTNLLSSGRVAATIGGIAIAIGVLTYSKKVMMTVGSSIAPLTQIEGFLVIIAMALTIVIMGNTMNIPVSTSQAVVGAVVGAGLTKSWRCVNFGVFKNIAIAWVSSPVGAGLLTYLVALATKTWFA